MKILSAKQIREADQYTINNEPIKSIDLMERAAKAFTNWFMKHFEVNQPIAILAGIGNNGGDAVAIARLLHQQKYKVDVFLISYKENYSDGLQTNIKRIEATGIKLQVITENNSLPDLGKYALMIDGLFGSGINRAISGFPAKCIKHINQLTAKIIAIDIPSGLYADKHTSSKAIIQANYTITFELPKLAFFFAENYKYVGEWFVVNIGLSQSFIDKQKTNHYLIAKNKLQIFLKKRHKFEHKGTFGHALIIAGSYGKMGATILSSKACLKTGAGLVSSYIPICGYEIMQGNFPEAMVLTDQSEKEIKTIKLKSDYDAIGIGPGLGTSNKTQKAFINFLKTINQPLVIDADGLNILSKNKEALRFIPARSILTPHPKELERLIGKTKNNFHRLKKVQAFSKKYNLYTVLKGDHTAIICPSGEIYFNNNGNPGMGTGGTGDVLTGMLTGLLAQGYTEKQACLLGVYLHGSAGDLAAEKYSQEALTAGDLIECIGKAYKELEL